MLKSFINKLSSSSKGQEWTPTLPVEEKKEVVEVVKAQEMTPLQKLKAQTEGLKAETKQQEAAQKAAYEAGVGYQKHIEEVKASMQAFKDARASLAESRERTAKVESRALKAKSRAASADAAIEELLMNPDAFDDAMALVALAEKKPAEEESPTVEVSSDVEALLTVYGAGEEEFTLPAVVQVEEPETPSRVEVQSQEEENIVPTIVLPSPWDED